MLYSAFVFMFDNTNELLILIYAAYAVVIVYAFFSAKRVSFYRESVILILYLVFGVISLLWAEDTDFAFSKIKTVFLLLVFLVIVSTYITKINKPAYVIAALSIGCIALSIYMVALYGFDGIMDAMQQEGEERLGFLINNVNALANTLSVGLIALIGAAFLYKRTLWLLIPAVFVSICLLSAGSRTATISLIVGLLILTFFWVKTADTILKKIFRFLLVVTSVIVLWTVLSNIPAFQTLILRTQNIFSVLTGDHSVVKESSTETRMDYIRLGWEQFLRTPIFGNGFGCAGYAMAETYTYVTYLHNNYIEILASGGIVGFILYYSPYVMVLFSLLKRMFKDHDRDPAVLISFALLVTRLISHVGIVLYYSKIEFIFLLLLISVVNIPRQKAKEAALLEAEPAQN